MSTTTAAPLTRRPATDPGTCLPVCAYLLATIRQHAEGCALYRNPYGAAWCTACRRRRPVLDRHTEGTYTAVGEEGCVVEALSCGHDRVIQLGVIGPAPGASRLPGAAATTREVRTTPRPRWVDPWDTATG